MARTSRAGKQQRGGVADKRRAGAGVPRPIATSRNSLTLAPIAASAAASAAPPPPPGSAVSWGETTTSGLDAENKLRERHEVTSRNNLPDGARRFATRSGGPRGVVQTLETFVAPLPDGSPAHFSHGTFSVESTLNCPAGLCAMGALVATTLSAECLVSKGRHNREFDFFPNVTRHACNYKAARELVTRWLRQLGSVITLGVKQVAPDGACVFHCHALLPASLLTPSLGFAKEANEVRSTLIHSALACAFALVVLPGSPSTATCPYGWRALHSGCKPTSHRTCLLRNLTARN